MQRNELEGSEGRCWSRCPYGSRLMTIFVWLSLLLLVCY